MMRASSSEYTLNEVPKFKPRMRRKSLPRNNFRGIKKEELQRQTSMYLASMTVS